MLVENYGLKEDIAKGVVEIVKAGPQSHGKISLKGSSSRKEEKAKSKRSNSSATKGCSS